MNAKQCTTDDVMNTVALALSFSAKWYPHRREKILRFSRLAILEIPNIFYKCHLAALRYTLLTIRQTFTHYSLSSSFVVPGASALQSTLSLDKNVNHQCVRIWIDMLFNKITCIQEIDYWFWKSMVSHRDFYKKKKKNQQSSARKVSFWMFSFSIDQTHPQTHIYPNVCNHTVILITSLGLTIKPIYIYGNTPSFLYSYSQLSLHSTSHSLHIHAHS